MSQAAHLPAAKQKLLDAALSVIRAKGFAATSVDELCAAAGVAKGSFFHHFKTKDALAVAAADYWSQMTSAFFAAAPYHAPKDPLARVLGYIDFRKSILTGRIQDYTCLIGTMVQEVYDSAPEIRQACEASILAHVETIEADIEAAMKLHKLRADWTARSLALHTQAVLQGAFILAKATGSTEIAAESVDHLRRYVECLFGKYEERKAA
jgi:TetR/AcrR family transcriptional repressor of nem operon